MDYFQMSPEEVKNKIDNMVWSFSRIQSSTCMYSWFLNYIAGIEGTPNAYSQFGTLCHETLEKFLKGELDIFTVGQYYQDHYSDYVTCDFPPNKYKDLGEAAYQAGLDYFNNIDFDFDKYEVLGVEKELLFNVGDYPFHGYADAIYRCRDTGEIILRDHKTSSFKYLKNGSISKSNQEVYEHYRRQAWLYCIPLIEMYGKVDYVSWNMIRDQRIIQIPFDKKEFNETREWAIDRIKTLSEEVLWLPNTSSSYFCSVLCDFKNICSYRQ